MSAVTQTGARLLLLMAVSLRFKYARSRPKYTRVVTTKGKLYSLKCRHDSYIYIYSECSYRRSSRDFKVSCIDHVEGLVGMWCICVCMLGVSMATPKPGDCF